MTNIKFPRKQFEAQLGQKITKETEEKISLFGTPLEYLTAEEIEIEIFPNRPDLLSLQGYIRAFKAFLGKSPGLKRYKLEKPKLNYRVSIASSVKSVRPFTVCAIVTQLQFNDEKIKEIIDLQEKLHTTIGRKRKKVAIGIYPLEKITLPISYKALPPEKIKFQPLEETKELTARQILNRHPAGKEYRHLLEDKDLFPIFTDAKSRVLSMPPIINSHETGKVTENTKEIFVECSGNHLPTLKKTLNIIITTLAEMGGKPHQMVLDYRDKKLLTPDLTPEKIHINPENINSLLGIKLKETDLARLLQKMGYNYENKTCLVPAWRTDILHEVDIAEDVAIAYGYDNFKPEIPNIQTFGSEDKKEKFKSKLREILLGLGLTEVLSYHLIKKEEARLSQIKEKIEVRDSKTEYKILRPNLLIPALRILAQNKDHEYPQETFEIGTVFSREDKEQTGIKETESLCITLAPSNFTKIKQILDYLAASFNFKYQLNELNHPQLIEGRTGEITINNTPSGYLGEVHPQTLKNWTIKMPLAVLEISLEEIFR